MTGGMPVAAAALAGVPAGVQAQGIWAGRRQLFVRFAGEAETATMYTAAVLVREMERQFTRSRFHSVSIAGRDPLANLHFLVSALESAKPPVPVMLDTDGQRPEALSLLIPHLAMVQVTIELIGSEAMVTHAMETLSAAAGAKCAHAMVLCPRDDTTDGQVLRVIEQTHLHSAAAHIVIHPPMLSAEQPMLDRRWATLLEHAMGTHSDVTLSLRLPSPTGLR